MVATSTHRAKSPRLIPVSGIGGPDEQERRATSALLAVIASVKEFARAVLGPLGGASGKVDTVPLDRLRA